MRLYDLRHMPPGDRGPTLRIAASRVLASLDKVEAEPRRPGRDAAMKRDWRIAVRQAKLLHLLKLAKLFGLALQPAAAERSASHRRANMTTESATEMLGTAILSAMKGAIEGGLSPVEAVDTALMAAGSIGIQAEGEFKFGAKLVLIGEGLVDGSPERAAKRSTTRN